MKERHEVPSDVWPQKSSKGVFRSVKQQEATRGKIEERRT